MEDELDTQRAFSQPEDAVDPAVQEALGEQADAAMETTDFGLESIIDMRVTRAAVSKPCCYLFLLRLDTPVA